MFDSHSLYQCSLSCLTSSKFQGSSQEFVEYSSNLFSFQKVTQAQILTLIILMKSNLTLSKNFMYIKPTSK
jgi:hypothetical protein